MGLEMAVVCVSVLNGIGQKIKLDSEKKTLKHAIDQRFKWSPMTNLKKERKMKKKKKKIQTKKMRANEFLWDFCLIHATENSTVFPARTHGCHIVSGVGLCVCVCSSRIRTLNVCQNVAYTFCHTRPLHRSNKHSIGIKASEFGIHRYFEYRFCIQSQLILNVNTFSIRWLST